MAYDDSRRFMSIRLDEKWTHINFGMGCPNSCAYCIQYKDIEYNDRDTDKRYSIDSIVSQVENDPYVSKHQPLVLGNATDPFIRRNLDYTKSFLKELDSRKYRNPLSIITKVYPDDKGLLGNKTLRSLRNLDYLQPSLLVSYAGYNSNVEKVSARDRVRLISKAKDYGIPVILYYRPFVRAWMDDPREGFEKKVERVAKETLKADAMVYSGLVYNKEIMEKIRKRGLKLPAKKPYKGKLVDDNKALELAKKIFKEKNPDLPIFRSTSCGVSYLYRIPNFLGYYGLRSLESENLECHHPCVQSQRDVCRKSTSKLSKRKIRKVMKEFGIKKRFSNHDWFIRIYDEMPVKQILYLQQNLSKLVIDDSRFAAWKEEKGMKAHNLKRLKVK